MTTQQTNTIAKIAAVVAGLGLVAMSFASGVVSIQKDEPVSRETVATTTRDGLDYDRARALQAKASKELHDEKFAKYAAFCGSAENVQENGFGWEDETHGVSGCKDYSKVPDENL